MSVNNPRCVQLFGVPHSQLTPEQRLRYGRLHRATTYFRTHEKNKSRQRRTKRLAKQDLITALGIPAECARCGYDTYLGALDFHHRDPTIKDGPVHSLAEARKCDLVCANCHRELHHTHREQWGVPLKNTGRPRQPVDPLLPHYMRLCGITEEIITNALANRPTA